MNRIQSLLTIGFLIILNLFWIYKFIDLRAETKKLYFNSNSNQRELDFYKDLANELIKENASVNLKKILGTKKVIFFYKVDACETCLERVYADLDILSSLIGRENILIINNGRHLRNDLNPEFYMFNSVEKSSIVSSFEKYNVPFLFVSNGEMISNIFIPDYFEDIRVDYFTNVLPNQFK